ncbi:hypothetical protein NBRC116602_03760 [Hyphomicrobiales bacterium 4NK60-0047b]
MSQNIAILIGNSEYSELTALDCCKQDVFKMKTLLSATDKFNQFIEFVDKPISEVKDALRTIARGSESIEELFFYFSGHGVSTQEDFFMCFKDFKETSPNTSGFARQELLGILRSFDADLVVNVIDACEAGKNLIKSEQSPLEWKFKGGLDNFIQFAPCTEFQNSIAGENISVFTQEFISACLQKKSGLIYYTDIENGLRDAYIGNVAQTPRFIRQGTSLEKFCNDASLLKFLREEQAHIESEEERSSIEIEPTINMFDEAEKRIKQIDKKIPSNEVAQNFIDGIVDAAISNTKFTSELSRFFELRAIQHDGFTHVQNKKSIVNLLNRRGGFDSFVECEVEKVKRRSDPNLFKMSQLFVPTPMMGRSKLKEQDDYDEKYELWNHSELTSVHVGIYFEPKYMALKRIFSEIVFLPRLTECLILTCNSFEQRSGWGAFNEYDGLKEWSWSSHGWFEVSEDIADSHVTDPFDFAQNYIHSFVGNEQ